MSDRKQTKAPGKTRKDGASVLERRRRQAEQLRANLLKRKEQSRNRGADDPAPAESGREPDTG